MESLILCCNDLSIREINRLAMGADNDVLLYDKRLDLSAISDKLVRVLHSFERYGAVSPRMQDGSWLSLPYDKGTDAIPPEKEALLQNAAKAYLPEVAVVPSVRSSCALIRRDVISNFGFLDPSYRTVEGALTDFCCRVNRYGYSMIAANHLFLPNGIARRESPSDRKKIQRTYPLWEKTLSQYIRHGIHACDAFLTLLAKGYHEKVRLILNYVDMPPCHNGTSQVQLGMLRYLREHCGDTFDLFICANAGAVAFHRLKEYSVPIVDPNHITGVYHISYSGTQPFYPGPQMILNHHCLRNVYTMLDIIMCRCDYLQRNLLWRDDVARLIIGNSDGLVFISHFGQDDFRAYFAGDPELLHCRSKVVHLADPAGGKLREAAERRNPPGLKAGSSRSATIPFTKYVLVPGSPFVHKGLRRTVDAVKGTGENYITLGLPKEGILADNVYNYHSGHLSDESLSQLYHNSSCVLFPSLYEGFGLPVLLAAQHGKRLILQNAAINRELLSAFPQLGDYVTFITRFDQIPSLVNRISTLPALAPVRIPYTREDSARQIHDFLWEVLETPINPQALQEKYQLITTLEAIRTVKPKARSSQRFSLFRTLRGNARPSP